MSTPSRRGFVTRATGALLIPVWGNRALGRTVDPRVAKVLTSTLAIDITTAFSGDARGVRRK